MGGGLGEVAELGGADADVGRECGEGVALALEAGDVVGEGLVAVDDGAGEGADFGACFDGVVAELVEGAGVEVEGGVLEAAELALEVFGAGFDAAELGLGSAGGDGELWLGALDQLLGAFQAGLKGLEVDL